MNKTRLVWTTPEAEKNVMHCARVSNPKNQDSQNTKLLSYCIKNAHWSIFEMANICIEVETSRAIARQLLRHRSFSFQEFSQRYASIDEAQWESNRFKNEARRQDTKNRQNSIDDMTKEDQEWFDSAQIANWNYAHNLYKKALEKGIAKEQARVFLPEGQTMSRLYVNGTLRSWITYCILRTANGTQKEHVELATACWKIFKDQCPAIAEAVEEIHSHMKDRA
jgi:thymidylate synthase (FAD)